MTDADLLTILKQQLQILTDALDSFLSHLISVAKQMVATEGINDDNSQEYYHIVIMQARYLYNKRDTGEGEPRSLRYAKNNKLFAQKIEAYEGNV